MITLTAKINMLKSQLICIMKDLEAIMEIVTRLYSAELLKNINRDELTEYIANDTRYSHTR